MSTRTWLAPRRAPSALTPVTAGGGSVQAPGLAPAGGVMAFLRDPFRLALFVLTIVTVSRVHQHYPILRALRPGLLLVMFAGGSAFLNPRVTSGNILRHWPARALVLLVGITVGSMAFGISLGNSGRFILHEYSKTIIYAFLLLAAIRHAGDLYSFVWAYVISSGILVFFAQFVFGISKNAGSHVTRLSDLYTYDANDLGLVLIVGLGLTLLVFQTAPGKVRVLLVATMLGIASTIARSGSRGAFVGFIVFGLSTLLLVQSISVVKRIVILVATALALGLTAPPGYWEQMGTLLKPNEDYNATSKDGRKALIQRGFGYMISYPVFGVGIGNFQKAECTISVKAREHSMGTGLRCTPPHNSYVQAAAETGVLGFLTWCSLVFGGIGSMYRMRRRLPREWATADSEARFLYAAPTYLMLSLIGFAVTAFFLSFAWMDHLYILTAFVVGQHVSVARRMQHDGLTYASRRAVPTAWRSRRW